MSLRLLAIAASVLTLAACGTGPSRASLYGAGHSMADPAGEEGHADAVIRAAETGKPATWRTERGPLGSISPAGDAFTDASGRLCRVLRVEITRDAMPTRSDKVACRETDGTWIVTAQ